MTRSETMAFGRPSKPRPKRINLTHAEFVNRQSVAGREDPAGQDQRSARQQKRQEVNPYVGCPVTPGIQEVNSGGVGPLARVQGKETQNGRVRHPATS